jgi:TolB-like protein/tRNA A-37 threonylcarbamoyl transferase component Bud32
MPTGDISHYRILEKLGEGGMGEVYLAEDTVLDRKVALKFLARGLQEDPLARQRFLREAKSAAATEHPYVCQIFEVGEADGRSFISMEYVGGETLKETLDQGPLSVERVLVLASEIAEALEEAHREKVVHRDLKPANIMLTPGGHVKVMDFGLAKQLSAEDPASAEVTLTKLTEDGSTLGTLAYMSPEQLRGLEADLRSDIFSFGLVLYEMATGAHPFRKPSQVETASAIHHDAPPPLSRYTEEAPELLGHIVRKMLAKDPDQRYQSVHEIRTDLAELLHPPSSVATAEMVARSRPRRSAWRLGVGFVVFLALVGTVAWLIARDRQVILPAGEITSLAVLPLDNLMGDPEQQYFVDGMHDALITELSKIGALRVISRTSVNRYRDTDDSLEEIARALRVDALVEGSILKSEDAVRITAQLVGVRPERHLWADHFERQLDDILSLQRDVARAIADEIQVTISPQEERLLAAHRPVPQEAHDAYFRALYYTDQRGEESLYKAKEALERAIDVAPDYALPYAGLAELYWFFARTTGEPAREALAKAKAYALEALELDDSLPEAHMALARINLDMDWNWLEAEQGVKRTLELNPSYSSAHGLYAHILLVTGRTDQASEELQKAIALAPLAHRYT